jgi:hypothetical protein
MNEGGASRSVKISPDERTGWSSERPRREGAPPRPVDISVRCRVLAPSDRLRYMPGSLLVIVGSAAVDPAKLAERVVEERGVVISPARVRALLTGRVDDAEIEERSQELLIAAVTKRLQQGESVVVPVTGFDRDDRERLARIAHQFRRPRHLILLDAGRDQVSDDERPLLDVLRRAVDSGEIGAEGFQTALRLGGSARSELKRIVFQPPPRDD